MRQLFLAVLLLIQVTTAKAQDSALVTLNTGEVSRGWEAVGRLDINQAGFCTASLIGETLILTAAHCVFDDNGDLIAPDRFIFQAGLRDGRAVATRRVIRTTPHPDYIHRADKARDDAVAADLAVLELDRPIRQSRVIPYAIGASPLQGAQVAVVSFARDRANAASLQQSCTVLQEARAIIVLTCAADFGASGAPVFSLADGLPRIVSVISAKGTNEGGPVSLATSLASPIVKLLTAHRAGQAPVITTAPRFVSSRTRNETGAKFVRP